MAIISVDQLKRVLKDETTYDEWLFAEAIDAAEAYLRARTGREWTPVTAASSATARSFRPEQDCEVLGIHDAASITSVVEDDITLVAGTDYVAEPFNNLSADGSWRPTDRLIRIGQTWYHDGPKATVVVTAKWGWSTMPAGHMVPFAVCAKAYLEARDVSLGLLAFENGGVGGQREAKAVADFINTYRKLAAWGV